MTCSADNTLRFWNADSKVSEQGLGASKENTWSSKHSKDLLHTIHLDVPAIEGKMISQAVRSSGDSLIYSAFPERKDEGVPSLAKTLSSLLPDTEIPDRPDSAGAPRSLAAHPTSASLAVGDRAGRVRIFQLETMTQTQCINAHDAEVLTLQYSPTPNYSMGPHANFATSNTRAGSGSILLASAGRDRLVHIFRADEPSQEYEPLTTLDNHSSSVTAMTFTVLTFGAHPYLLTHTSYFPRNSL